MIKKDIVVVLNDIRSSHNVGSIFRSSDAFGVDKIIVCGITPYPRQKNDARLPYIVEKLTKQINKTALGAESTVDFCYEAEILQAIKNLQKQHYKVLAIEQSANSKAIDEYEFPNSCALVFGNEVKGISKNVVEACDGVCEIPMLGKKESLNVAVTAGIMLYHLRHK